MVLGDPSQEGMLRERGGERGERVREGGRLWCQHGGNSKAFQCGRRRRHLRDAERVSGEHLIVKGGDSHRMDSAKVWT